MKKLLASMTFLAFSLGTMAQQNSGQPNDDQLQQQAPRETQIEVERAAQREAKKREAEALRVKAEQTAAQQKKQEAAKARKNKAKAKSTLPR